MRTEQCVELIEECLSKLLKKAPLPGHNGPYFDEETPLRNIAHRIVLLSIYSRIQNRGELCRLIRELADQLLEEKYRPGNYTFVCRNNEKKDKTNGVIGQAWIIEGLVEAYRFTEDVKYLDTAREVFLLHPFDETLCIWHCVGIDGAILPCDMTFNHQLWFAAAGAMLNQCIPIPEIQKNLTKFTRALPRIFSVHKNGLIIHKIRPAGGWERAKYEIKIVREYVQGILKKPNMEYKEIGYHLFNLYGFALLYHRWESWDPLCSKSFLKALKFCSSKTFIEGLKDSRHHRDINCKNMKECGVDCNRYGFAYNAPGFEMPYIFKTFQGSGLLATSLPETLLNAQLQYTFDREKKSFNHNTEDPLVLNERLYELSRILELEERESVVE